MLWACVFLTVATRLADRQDWRQQYTRALWQGTGLYIEHSPAYLTQQVPSCTTVKVQCLKALLEVTRCHAFDALDNAKLGLPPLDKVPLCILQFPVHWPGTAVGALAYQATKHDILAAPRINTC
jgi:hypothetical protein